MRNDSKNCCVLDRDCQGSACISGMCQPITVVSDATADPRGIRNADAFSILWATGCTREIRKAAKDGSSNVGLPKGANCGPLSM